MSLPLTPREKDIMVMAPFFELVLGNLQKPQSITVAGHD
jgi:hypothetical protein